MKARAAVHVHSNWSHDGRWPLSKLVPVFGKAGYQLIFTTEHCETFDNKRLENYRRACIDAGSRRVLIVPGIEYRDPTNTLHVLVWGEIPFFGAGNDIIRLLESVRDLNGLAVFAHPSRMNAWREFDPSWAPLLLGLEQWSRKYDGVAPSVEATVLLNEHPSLMPFVGLDFHSANQFFPLSMSVELGDVFSEEAALNALRRRDVSAEVFGMPLRSFTSGIGNQAVTAAERLRRIVRRAIVRIPSGRRMPDRKQTR